MARTTLTAQTVTGAVPIASLAFNPVDATNGNQWIFTGRRRLIVNNAAATAITVTVRTPAAVTVAGLAVPDRPVSVPAGKLGFVIESPEARQSADGMVYVDFSSGTSVTAALVEEL